MSSAQPEAVSPRRMADTMRQVSVGAGAAVAIVASAAGAGAFGGVSIASAAGGAFSSEATVLAPAGPAFGIWSVIYAGLAAFAVFQALPSQATNPRLRTLSWWVLLSMLLNAAWIVAARAELLSLSVAVIVALVVVLAIAAVGLRRVRPTTVAEALVTDATVGAYLGWTAVATIANVTAVLVDAGAGPLLLGPTGWSVTLMALGAAVAVSLAVYARYNPALTIGIGVAMAWGLMWIALGRLMDDPANLPVGWAAGIAAAIAFGAPFAAIDFSRGDHRVTRSPAQS